MSFNTRAPPRHVTSHPKNYLRKAFQKKNRINSALISPLLIAPEYLMGQAQHIQNYLHDSFLLGMSILPEFAQAQSLLY
jgi:hypothetical protein